MYCLCDTIALKQLLEDTYKVQGKSLTTALDELHFVIHKYSFPLPLVLQANPSFPKVSHLPTSQAKKKKFKNSSLSSFSINPFFEDISTPRLESAKW